MTDKRNHWPELLCILSELAADAFLIYWIFTMV